MLLHVHGVMPAALSFLNTATYSCALQDHGTIPMGSIAADIMPPNDNQCSPTLSDRTLLRLVRQPQSAAAAMAVNIAEGDLGTHNQA